ncbi:putative homeodomain transcription factor 1 [Galendromus occidentalis]|uniref:Homeodomain transcription factor 1 n=1 Tax=Galendromus occidentalis TaxID=34638 RepID=A0AAJ7WIQ0_9ACAR|nr:putative homeodomain transcription factor 1 [Galendromus occidentalis]XP_028968312.1 putative homeodomain transcription factor 1 [Galendromus occidentalis]
MDLKLDQSLGWYQKKIGAYDKEAWERHVERRVLRGVSGLPKKSAKFKAGFIDVDLVRGSTFKKKKPRSSWLMLCAKGALRVLLYPLYITWWTQHTSHAVSMYFLFLYLSQIYATYLNVYVNPQDDFDLLVIEVITPLVVMCFLGAIHEQIATKSVSNGANFPKHGQKRRLRRKLHKAPSEVEGKQAENKEDSKESGLESLDFATKNTVDSSEKGSSPTSLSEPQTPEHHLKIVISSDDDEFFIAKSRSEMNNLRRRRKLKRRSDGVLYDLNHLRLADDLNAHRRLSAESGASYIRNHIWDKLSDDRNETASSADESQFPQGLKNQSDFEWPSQTDCNYISSSSENLHSDEATDDDDYGDDIAPLQCSSVDKVSCTIWEHGDCKKVDLSIFDIASAIVRKVENWRHANEYPVLALVLSFVLALYPFYFKTELRSPLQQYYFYQDATETGFNSSALEAQPNSTRESGQALSDEAKIITTACLVRLSLSCTFFYLLCVAERTFTQRFLYAKHFCQLTSARRAYRSELPHFRLNKVRNIKTWLSVRSYLKKHGPQQSVDAIVSTAFVMGVCVLSLFCAQMLRDGHSLEKLFCCECALWCIGIGVFMTRFMMLGLKINKKYRNHSILITEQINLYLHMEQKPQKKDELVLVNNVLKLAADLLKELESPFKISGICANPYLYNITKVICVSAFSAALSELLGFKLKLHKIKIK